MVMSEATAFRMESVTPNVFTNTKLRGCNPSYVVTSDGVVVIDTPQLPTRAVAMRAEAESHGPIRYLVNTEHHVDHIFGNYFFKGAGTVVFTGDLTLHVGDHTFHCLWTPGHTPGQLAVHVPEERVVFTGDTIFSGCQTWLMTSDVDQWLAALERIRMLDVDRICPGHGPVVPKSYLDVQRAHLMDWKTAVADAIARGWSREETIARVDFRDAFGPVDIGQGYMLDYIQNLNAASLYDKLQKTIVPLFYGNRNGFVDVMLHSIALNGSFFNTHLMLQQYVMNAYFL